jgi:hypothetical protein
MKASYDGAHAAQAYSCCNHVSSLTCWRVCKTPEFKLPESFTQMRMPDVRMPDMPNIDIKSLQGNLQGMLPNVKMPDFKMPSMPAVPDVTPEDCKQQ